MHRRSLPDNIAGRRFVPEARVRVRPTRVVCLQRVRIAVAMVSAAVAMHGHAVAQQLPPRVLNPEGAAVYVLPVRENVFMISGAGGNITASVGVDGVLMVDTGLAQMGEEVLGAIRRIQDALQVQGLLLMETAKRGGAETESRMPYHPSMSMDLPMRPVRHIINTHAHAENVGGNEYFAALGITYTSGNVAGTIADAAEGARVMAHENVLNRMLLAERSFASLPTLTYFTDGFKFRTYFNGEGIRLFHMPNAHTDGDTIVYFHGSDVISTGGVFSMETFPAIDVEAGGHIDGIIDALNFIIDLSIPEFRTEGGTMIVPGHGRLADSADVTYYRDMLTIIRDRVRHMIDGGMSLGEIQEARPTFGYNGRWGAEEGAWTTEIFVQAIFRNLTDD